MIAEFNTKEKIFVDFLEDVSEYYEKPNRELTQEDIEIVSIMMEYFDENYKIQSLNESAKNVLIGYDPNQELYEEIVSIMMDETLGSAIANVAYGLKTRKANKLFNKGIKSYGKGLKSGPLMKSFRFARAGKLIQKSDNIYSDVNPKKSNLAAKIDNSIIGKTANKIGSGISAVVNAPKNIKNSIQNSIKKTAMGAASKLGRALAF
jgi:hypothetical protein